MKILVICNDENFYWEVSVYGDNFGDNDENVGDNDENVGDNDENVGDDDENVGDNDEISTGEYQ